MDAQVAVTGPDGEEGGLCQDDDGQGQKCPQPISTLDGCPCTLLKQNANRSSGLKMHTKPCQDHSHRLPDQGADIL